MSEEQSINPDLFDEDFEADLEDGFEDFDFDEDDLEDLEDSLVDDEPEADEDLA